MILSIVYIFSISTAHGEGGLGVQGEGFIGFKLLALIWLRVVVNMKVSNRVRSMPMPAKSSEQRVACSP